MAAKYDAERLLDDLLTIIKSNLNAKITAIQTEKDILLGVNNFDVPSVEDAAYFDSLDDKVANFNPYVYYGIGDNAVIENESAEADEITAFFTVVLADNGKPDIYKIMLRYIRALREIISENFGKIPEASNLQVITITPSNVIDQDGTEQTFHKIAGISLQTTIG